jgi:hypothetical protein
MSQKKANTAVAVQEGGFAVLANNDLSNIISEELDGLDLSFDRIKIVNNANVFTVPTDGDDTVTVPEFSAVIVHQHAMNAFYRSAYKGGNVSPDCGSYDGKFGTGNPGGNCAVCRFNQYGTGENGLSKACKNRRRIYALHEGERFPMLLSLPPASLKPFTKYLKSLLSKGLTSNAVVTRFSLKKATSGNMTYSQAVFSIDRLLTPQEAAAIKPLSEQVKSYAANVGYDNTGYDEESVDLTVNYETGEIIEPLGR